MTQKERAYLFRKLTTEDAEIFLKASKEENLAPFILSTFLATTLDEAKEKLSRQEIYGLILFVGDEPARIVSALSIESVDSGAQVEYFVSKEFRGKRFSAIGIRLLEQEMIGKYKYFDFIIPSLADGANIWLQGFIRSELISMKRSDKIYRYMLKE